MIISIIVGTLYLAAYYGVYPYDQGSALRATTAAVTVSALAAPLPSISPYYSTAIEESLYCEPLISKELILYEASPTADLHSIRVYLLSKTVQLILATIVGDLLIVLLAMIILSQNLLKEDCWLSFRKERLEYLRPATISDEAAAEYLLDLRNQPTETRRRSMRLVSTRI